MQEMIPLAEENLRYFLEMLPFELVLKQTEIYPSSGAIEGLAQTTAQNSVKILDT